MPLPSNEFRCGAPSSEYATPNSLPPATEIRTPVFIEYPGEGVVCTARPESVISCVTCRAFSGSSTMRWLSTTVPTPGVRVSTSGVDPPTCTSSAMSPSDNTGSMTGVLFTCRTMPVRATVRKPFSAASSRYEPSGRFGSAKAPVSFVPSNGPVRCRTA